MATQHTLHKSPASKNALSAGMMSVCRSSDTDSLAATVSSTLCDIAADLIA